MNAPVGSVWWLGDGYAEVTDTRPDTGGRIGVKFTWDNGYSEHGRIHPDDLATGERVGLS